MNPSFSYNASAPADDSFFGSVHEPFSSSSEQRCSISLGSERNFDSQHESSKVQMPAGVKASDVLCGRDKLSHSHVGNKHFRHIIELFREQYQAAQARDQKTQITCEVIAKIHSDGGRFLKLDPRANEWKEVNEQYAREKVSHALRSAKDPNRPRVKKPRKTKQYVPTEEENAIFREALQDQQRIFQTLIASHNDGEGDGDEEEMKHSSEDSTSGDEDDDGDWEFYQ